MRKRRNLSYLLAAKQRARGYRITIEDRKHTIKVRLHHRKKYVGVVFAYQVLPRIWEPHSILDKPYQNRGFGKLLYAGLVSYLAAPGRRATLHGKPHTLAAHRAHAALRRDLGIKYCCTRLQKPRRVNGFVCRYGHYVVPVSPTFATQIPRRILTARLFKDFRLASGVQ